MQISTASNSLSHNLIRIISPYFTIWGWHWNSMPAVNITVAPFKHHRAMASKMLPGTWATMPSGDISPWDDWGVTVINGAVHVSAWKCPQMITNVPFWEGDVLEWDIWLFAVISAGSSSKIPGECMNHIFVQPWLFCLFPSFNLCLISIFFEERRTNMKK